MLTRPAIFKWRQTEPGIILCAVRWYLRYSLSLRDVEELLEERGLNVDHTTVWRWVQNYGPELEQRLRRHLKPTNKSWRVDETYVRVKGRWCYLYRAIDSAGATIDFLLSALRDADAAKRLFRKALGDRSHPQPRVINTDLAPIYSSAIPDSKTEGTLRTRCRHRPVQYLNNVLEQDHRAIKRRVNAKQGFREFQAARRTIQGYEVIHMMRKGQVRWVSGTDIRRQNQFTTTCSSWPPEILTATLAGPSPTGSLEVAKLPNRVGGADQEGSVQDRQVRESEIDYVGTMECGAWRLTLFADPSI